MTWSGIVNATRSRFDELVAVPNALETFIGNQPLGASPPDGRWCRLSVQGADRYQASLGRRHFRTPGVLFVAFFEPLGTGDGHQNDLIDALDDAFLGVELVVTESPYLAIRWRPPVPIGEPHEDAGQWWQQDVQIPFVAEYIAGALQ